MPKGFVSSTINTFVLYLEGGLENPKKEHKLGENSFCETSFQLRMVMKNGKKFGREERMQEDYPTFAVYFLQMSGNLLVLFHLCLVSVAFSGQSLTKNEVSRNFFLLVVVCFVLYILVQGDGSLLSEQYIFSAMFLRAMRRFLSD